LKPKFFGKYVLHCVSCYGKNFTDSIEPIILQTVTKNVLKSYQKTHDVSEYHDVILIHESRLAKYVLKNIVGGKVCQKIML